MLKDGRYSATLIFMKICHFDRTALYGLKLLELKAVAWSVILLDKIECNYVYIQTDVDSRRKVLAAWSVTLLDSKSVSIYVLILFI